MVDGSGIGSRTRSIGVGTVVKARCVAGVNAALGKWSGCFLVDVPAALLYRIFAAAVLSPCQSLSGAGVGLFAVLVSRLREALVYGGPLLLQAHLDVSGPGALVTLNQGSSIGAAKACYSALLLWLGSGPCLLQVLLEVGCRLLRVHPR